MADKVVHVQGQLGWLRSQLDASAAREAGLQQERGTLAQCAQQAERELDGLAQLLSQRGAELAALERQIADMQVGACLHRSAGPGGSIISCHHGWLLGGSADASHLLEDAPRCAHSSNLSHVSCFLFSE